MKPDLVLDPERLADCGVLFALVMPRNTRPGTALVAWIIYGALIWAFMKNLVVPRINPTRDARLAMMPGWFFIEHLLFGVGASFGPALRRRFGGAYRPARPSHLGRDHDRERAGRRAEFAGYSISPSSI